MNRTVKIAVWAAAGWLTLLANVGAAQTPVVYVIPIQDVIGRTLVYVMRRGLREAEQQNARAIVFDMNTPGGQVDATSEILDLLRHVRVPTYTYCNPEAISAGAILALSTDHIYMAPGGRIGDAMPILLSPFGTLEKMPDSVEEKTLSYVASLIRSAAQLKGHDPRLAEAMVRREIEYKLGDEVISPAGQLLTLTSHDAERPRPDGRPLLSEGTVENLEALLERIGLKNADVVEIEVTWAERLAYWIESLSVLLLAGGVLGLYIEFKTPGFGFPGIAGILLLAIWFWGHHVAGLAGQEELFLFAAGLILLAVEVFVLPGFGFVGAAGIALMLASLLMGMSGRLPGGPWYPTLAELGISARNLAAALVLAFLGALAAGRWLPRTAWFSHLVLGTSADRGRGFVASSASEDLVGLTGTAISALHPSGTAIFDGRRMDVVTRGEFVPAGTPIRIVSTEGNRLMVEPIA